jgi:7,8-dihydro-6-hydroxymethylpterin dimethyltransferase
MPGFEVYLQFDSLRGESLRRLRGADLSDVRRRALEALNRHGISTTLVVTLVKGVNDGEIGEIIDFALAMPCVRGVTFQPVQCAGRLPADFDPRQRLTLSAVRSAILRQHSLFTARDVVPVPCHTDALAMGYAVRRGRGAVPLSKLVDPAVLMGLGGNTICYEQDPAIRRQVHELFSAAASPASAAAQLNLLCCVPALSGVGRGLPLAYDQIFRVIIMQFMDAYSMDLRSLKRSCVHIVHPDGRLIPFDTYNLLYRGRAAGGLPEDAANVGSNKGD